MSCCRQNQTAPMTERHRFRVRYGGARPVQVTGPVTGVSYRFSGVDRVQLVDPRDAVALVRNSIFSVDGVVELASE